MKEFTREIVQFLHPFPDTVVLLVPLVFLGLRKGDAGFFRQKPQGFWKGHLLHFHDESDDIPAFAASETMKAVTGGGNHEARGFFAMKGTEPLIAGSGSFKGYILTDNGHDISSVLDPLDDVIGILHEMAEPFHRQNAKVAKKLSETLGLSVNLETKSNYLLIQPWAS